MKKLLYIAGGVIGAVVLAVVVFVATFDINAYKPRIEAAASEATGLQVTIGGKMSLTVLAGVGASLEGLRVTNKGTEVFSAKKVAVGVELMPLLHKEVKVKTIEVDSPDANIVKDKDGRYNFAPTKKKGKEKASATATVSMDRITIRDGHIVYSDLVSGTKAELTGCGLGMDRLTFESGDPARTLSSDGELTCANVGTKDASASDIRAGLKVRDGDVEGDVSVGEMTSGKIHVTDISSGIKVAGDTFEADGIKLKVFGGMGSGSFRRVLAGGSPVYTVDFSLAGMKVEEALEAFGKKKPLRGPLDLKTRLTFKGKTSKDFKRTAAGDFSVRGHDLAMDGMDLDSVLDKYEQSQSVSLYDVGSVFILGPLGPLLTKGVEFGGVYKETRGGVTNIRQFVSDWKVGGGGADAKDVAFSTRRNRVAMKGRLNLVAGRYDGITVAVLDKEGHATFSQKIHGEFNNPQVEKMSTFKVIAGSILGMFEKAKDLFTQEKRAIFYNGSVKHPI